MLIILPFVLAHFSHHVCTGVLAPLLPLLRQSFGLNYFQSGVLISSFSLAYGFGQVPMAVLADRFSRRSIIIGGLMGAAASGIGVSLTQQFWQMIPLFVLMGLFGSSYHAPASSFLAQSIPIENRGRALGLHVTGGTGSFFITPILALWIASVLQTWRYSFFLLALPSLLAAGLIWRATEEPADETGAGQTIKNNNSAKGVNAAGNDQEPMFWMDIVRALGVLVSLTILLNIIFSSINSYLPLYMVDHHGISPKWAGIVVSVIAGAGMIGAPVGGALSDRVGRKRIILSAFILSGPLFFAVTRSPYGLWLLLALILYGFSMSVRMPTTESLIADVVPVNRRTTVLGIYFFLTMETAGVVTPIIGRLIDIYGLDAVFTFISLGLCVLAVIALAFSKKI